MTVEKLRVKTVGFLLLTALLIGAKARRVHCPFCAQPPLLSKLASLSSRQFDSQHQGMGVSALCLAPTCKSHPVHCLHRIRLWHTRLFRRASHPGPTGRESAIADGPSIVGTLSRDRCQSLLHGSTMERAPTSAAESARRASTDEWSPRSASGFTPTSVRCGIIS